MKKTVSSFILMLCILAPVISQTGDARIRGMANAFTAVADDANAIFFNPAGLAYLDKSYLYLGIDGSNGYTMDYFDYENPFPYVIKTWDGGTQQFEYHVYDDFLGTETTFDPSVYGFAYDPADPESYIQAVEEYMTWKIYYDESKMLNAYSGLSINPRFAYADRYWGIASYAENTITPSLSEYLGKNSLLTITVNKDTGVIAACGGDFGIMAVGVNFKYYIRNTDSFNIPFMQDTQGYYPSPMNVLANILFGSETEQAGISHYEMGAGGLLTLDSLSFGAYIDNLLFFLPDAQGTANTDLTGIFNSLSVGAAFTPFDDILNFIAAADLKNLGSSTDRELTAGIEAGLNLGNLLVANARAGYRQLLPGTLTEMLTGFDPRLGTVSVGLGGKLLIAAMDVTAEFPAALFFDAYYHETDASFCTLSVNMSLSF